MKHFLAACFLHCLFAGPVFAADLMIAATEKPVRLIRGVQTWKAGAGVVLQKGDILESGLNSLQIEIPPSMVMAVAPHSRLYVVAVGDKPEFAVLEGWLKLRSKGLPVALQSSLMRSHSSANSLVFHAETGKSELFPEEGEMNCTPFDAANKDAAEQKITQEQYVMHLNGQPMKVMARPSKEFLAAIPKAFRDALNSQAGKMNGKVLEPEAEYDIQYADVEAWLKTDLPVKKELVKRFKPMLKNPEFRKALEAELGQMPEWKAALHPPVKKAVGPADNTIY